jgi:hypothetical protein
LKQANLRAEMQAGGFGEWQICLAVLSGGSFAIIELL